MQLAAIELQLTFLVDDTEGHVALTFHTFTVGSIGCFSKCLGLLHVGQCHFGIPQCLMVIGHQFIDLCFRQIKRLAQAQGFGEPFI